MGIELTTCLALRLGLYILKIHNENYVEIKNYTYNTFLFVFGARLCDWHLNGWRNSKGCFFSANSVMVWIKAKLSFVSFGNTRLTVECLCSILASSHAKIDNWLTLVAEKYYQFYNNINKSNWIQTSQKFYNYRTRITVHSLYWTNQ